MPNSVQTTKLVVLSLALWVLATLFIRLFPQALTDPLQGAIGFAATWPVGWLSVWLTRTVGALRRDQLLGGIAVVGAVAMMIDGVVLRWFPTVYGTDPLVLRLGAAWLLWGYGVSLAIALWMAGLPRSPAAASR